MISTKENSKKTLAVAIALMFTLLVSMAIAGLTSTQAYADDATVLSICQSASPNGEQKVIKSYTQADLDKLATTGTIADNTVMGYQIVKNGTVNVFAVTKYIKLDDLYKDAGVTFDSTNCIMVSDTNSTKPFSVTLTYNQVASQKYFYPNVSGTVQKGTTGAYEVPAVLALEYGTATIASTDETLSSTALATAAASATASEPRYFMGQLADSTSDIPLAGKRLVGGVDSVTVSTPLCRLEGSNRYETMENIVSEGFDRLGVVTSNTVIVASGANYPDALAASGLAGLDFVSGKNTTATPIVLTTPDTLSTEASDIIAKLDANNDTEATDTTPAKKNPLNVIIVGGTGAVSSSVESSLNTLVSADGGTVTRVSGGSRIATAEAIYTYGLTAATDDSGNKTSAWGNTAIITTSTNYADALSVSPYAYRTKSPIFLADSNGNISTDTLMDLVSGKFSNIVIVGGTAAVSDQTEGYATTIAGMNGGTCTRLAGGSRYETSSKIADYAVTAGVLSYDKFAVATGTNYPDALSGAGLCGLNGSTLLLVSDSDAQCITNNLTTNVKKITDGGYVLGGTGAVSDSIYSQLHTLIFGA